MLDFKLFNIPVRVEPWFWLTGFLIGGGLHMSPDQQGLVRILMWLMIVFVSILVHEFGHALTSRKLTGVNPTVKLVAMGGLAYPNTHLTRQQSFWVTWAGPLAGLGLFVLTVLATCLVYGFTVGLNIIGVMALPGFEVKPLVGLALYEMNWATRSLLYGLVFVNFWWSLINLLPVFPLDGGQIYASIEPSQKKVFQVGLVTGVIVAALSLLMFERLLPALLFGYLAFQNYQRLQQINGGGGFR